MVIMACYSWCKCVSMEEQYRVMGVHFREATVCQNITRAVQQQLPSWDRYPTKHSPAKIDLLCKGGGGWGADDFHVLNVEKLPSPFAHHSRH